MPARSIKSAKRTKKPKRSNRKLDRPFDRAILRRAGEIVEGYRLLLEPNEAVGFIGRAIELPNVLADGATPDECVRSTREALTTTVATMLEAGQRPPTPAGARQAQMNVRVSAEEKLLLEDTARRHGFRGVSDFVRTAALDRAGVLDA